MRELVLHRLKRTGKSKQSMNISKNSVVSFHYKLTDNDGIVLHSSAEREPVT